MILATAMSVVFCLKPRSLSAIQDDAGVSVHLRGPEGRGREQGLAHELLINSGHNPRPYAQGSRQAS